MAGIGFELKKLFSRRGLFASFQRLWICRDYLYRSHAAGDSSFCWVLCFCVTGQALRNRAENYWSAMITYTLLASLTVTSFLSMVVTRFIADMLYEEKK